MIAVVANPTVSTTNTHGTGEGYQATRRQALALGGPRHQESQHQRCTGDCSFHSETIITDADPSRHVRRDQAAIAVIACPGDDSGVYRRDDRAAGLVSM